MAIDESTQNNAVQKVITGEDGTTLPMNVDPASAVGTGAAAVFFFAGFVALVFIVIGGFRYVISGGDPQKVVQARNTIIYAIVGLIVAMSAFIIVRFIIGGAQGG